ncbi:MAG: type III-A CRISPR-associated RAMP protein Csm5 [Candidatus Poribacteria bacterium]|nr:type III-A CRISPR-associated RAMP protein Csm5 [Candidatus Poribacteria bacterium]
MKQNYQLEIVTPVHIGSGVALSHIDGYYANGQWYCIDLERVLAHPSADLNALTSEMGRRDFRWDHHLRQRNIDPAEVSVYSLSCPKSPEEVEIREAIKGIHDQPFIPGTTLKGAIRTALLGEIVSVSDKVYEKSRDHLNTLIERGSRGNPRREQPAHLIETLAFGRDPNRDIFRALQVSDTGLLKSDALEIGMAWTMTINQNNQLVQKIDRGREYKNFVQQIQAKQQLTFTLKIDDLLFREREKERLGFNDLQQETLQDIAEVCRSATDQLMRGERDFFSYYRLPEIANFYDKLISLNNTLLEGEFLLQIGWGAGYNANTVTALFTDDAESPVDWMDLRERFRLGESRSRRGAYDEREFPKTKRILYRGQNPLAPLGWVKISPTN